MPNFSDIDMIPIPKMDLNLENFLALENAKEKPCGKMCAFVIPTYEISMAVSHMPVNKTELLKFIKVK